MKENIHDRHGVLRLGINHADHPFGTCIMGLSWDLNRNLVLQGNHTAAGLELFTFTRNLPNHVQ